VLQSWQSKTRHCFLAVSFFIAAVFLAHSAFCLEQKAKDEPIVCNGDKIEYTDDNKRLSGTGNMKITYGDVKLTSDKVEVNLETKEAYATSNVVMTQGTNTFKAESVLYNFETKKGKILNGYMSAPPWYGKCDQIDKTGDKEYLLGSGYISTCDRIPPHYKIRTKEIKLYLGDKVVAKNVVICAGSVPILYLPVYTQSVKSNKPMVTVVPGHSKDWGYFNLTAFRYNFNDDAEGKIHFDLRSEKGVASGITHNYKLNFLENNVELGKGIFDFYYMNEDDKSKPEDAGREKQRYRVMLRHMWQMDDKTQAVMEYNKLTDPNFTKDYFYRQEYVNEVDPKTYFYMLRTEPEYSTGLLFQDRINNFFTETEYEPQVDIDIKNQKLFDNLPFYYKGEYNAASLAKKTAYSDVESDAGRLDGYNELSSIFMPLQSISLRPYVATRQTWYSRDINTDKDLTRGIFYTGIDTSTRLYKTYDLEAKFAGMEIHGLRHILTPVVRYNYVHKPVVSPERLTNFDDIDTINRNNTLTLALENNFQTKKLNKDSKDDLAQRYDIADFARVVLSTDYDFQRTPGGHFSNIIGNLELTPSERFLIESDVDFNPHSQKFDIANIDFVAKRSDGAKLGLGHRYERAQSSELTSDIYYPLTKKLGLHNYERYQFDGKQFKEQEYGVSYDLHCWTMDVNFNTGVNGSTVWVIFRLKAFDSFPIQLGSTYESPKPQTVGN